MSDAAPVPVLLLSRAADGGRRAGFAAAAARAGQGFGIVEAMDAHAPGADFSPWAHLLPARFWESDRIKPGAFACCLAHMAAWRRVAASGAATLICEDDARLESALRWRAEGALVRRPVGEAAGRGDTVAILPEAWDMILVNSRAAAWRRAAARPGDPDFLPLATLIARHAGLAKARSAPGFPKTPGADAYLLSPAGARRLLAMVEADRVVAGVDWMMIHYACPPPPPPAHLSPPPPAHLSAMIGAGPAPLPELASLRRMLPAPRPRLQAFVAPAPAASLAPGPSALRHAVTAPIDDLRAPPP